MSLLSDIETETARRGPRCTVAKLTEDHPEIVDELSEALSTDRYTGNAISRALAKRGIRIASETILRHRRGDCSCP